MQERWTEIQAIWKSNQVLYVITGFLAGALFFPAIEALSTNASELLSGFVPEAVGIAFTVLLIDRLYQRREQERQAVDTIKRLLRELGSRDNAMAANAVLQLREEKLLDSLWLLKPNLEEADLSKTPLYQANLSGISLRQANLRNADIRGAILNHTDLYSADLENGWLIHAKLQKAKMDYANMRKADLSNADLEGAFLFHTILQGAVLEHANLKNARLDSALFDNETVLPDGRRWESQTDLSSFTNSDHTRFWRGYEFNNQKDLQNRILSKFNLIGVRLSRANLQNTVLCEANLEGADLYFANLRNADMRDANLRAANFEGADLSGANLKGANLEYCKLYSVLTNTILPDGSIFTPTTDIYVFTDPKHPNFWRPQADSVWWCQGQEN